MSLSPCLSWSMMSAEAPLPGKPELQTAIRGWQARGFLSGISIEFRKQKDRPLDRLPRLMITKHHQTATQRNCAAMGDLATSVDVRTPIKCSSEQEIGKNPSDVSVEDCPNSSWSGKVGLLNAPMDSVTLASLLKRCGKDKSLLEGRRLHAYISRLKFDHDTFLGNCLIQMYGNCGSMQDAQAVFDKVANRNTYSWNLLINAHIQNGSFSGARSVFSRMRRRDVVSWNAMITACAQNSHGEQALEFFHQMQQEGVKPDNITFICVLDACSSMAALEEGQAVHAAIVDGGYEQDIIVGNTLINMYGKCRFLHGAKSVFCSMPQRDVVTWNAMITAFAHNQQGEEAVQLFHCMQAEGIRGDKITFVCVLDTCASLSNLAYGLRVHSAIVESEYHADVAVENSLVYMYGKCGSHQDARSVFSGMSERNVISWSVMISVCSQNGHGRVALEVFHQMQLQGVNPDKITFISILDACIDLASLYEGLRLHATIVGNGYERDVIVGNSLVNIYGKCRSMDNAKNVFNRMPERDVVSWSAMIAACTQNGHHKDALEAFCEMQPAGVNPDKITFVCVLDACASLAALQEGQEILAAILDIGYDHDVVVGTAIVNMYGKCGCLSDAGIVLSRMPQRDVAAWSAMIAACAQNGKGMEALEFFHQMQLEGIKPDEITFVSILTACSHMGCINEGWHYFISMHRDYHITPITDHYICMIDLLSRAGHLDEAEYLVKDTLLENLPMAWLILLNACRIHGDAQRGVRAANKCLGLDPKHSLPYVVLANIYAASGMWDEVE